MEHGSFDEYHFFLSSLSHARDFRSRQAPWIDPLGDRVKVFSRVDLVEHLRKTDYTVIHQSDHVTLFNAVCRLRTSLGLAIPVTAFVHSLSYQSTMNAYHEMLETGAREFDALISSSQCGKKVIENCFSRLVTHLNCKPEKLGIEVIPLGIAERPTEQLSREAAREALGIPQDVVIGLCFGRFSDFDKMDLFPLLQAFSRVAAADKPYSLILAGAVHDETYLKALRLWIQALRLQDRVFVITEPDEKEKAVLYAACDFFVSIADNPQETFGMTLLEALRAGLPLIVSDFDGYREIGSDEVAIRVATRFTPIEPLAALQSVMDNLSFHRLAAQSIEVDIGQLATAMRRLFEDPDLRRTLGAHARRRFEDEYAHAKTIRKLESLWDKLKAAATRHEPVADGFNMSLYETFVHYVSETISPADLVVASDFSNEVAAHGGNYPLLSGMSDVVRAEDVASILRLAQQPTSIQLLVGDLATEWKRLYTVMWMIKHELLQRSAP